MTEEMKLLPCPFCGNGNVVEIGLEEMGRDVYCPRCQASVVWTGDAKGDVIARWNHRAPSDLSRLRDAVVVAARVVSDELWHHGPSIAPHFCDTDDNPGQRLRFALAALEAVERKEADKL